MLSIDGSAGEGGGQILRSSLALSAVTGTPFRIRNIRARRPKPGLMRQHLTAVCAAAEICGAAIDGAEIGSRELTFTPGAVGTAGSTTLVLQTVLPALMTADGASELRLEGGTDNPFAPPFDFLAEAFLPLLARMGPQVAVELERAGFYPAGGGRLSARIVPVRKLRRLDLRQRGKLLSRRAKAVVARLPRRIADNEIQVLTDALGLAEEETQVAEVQD
ncbi:MAG: RNA 3'-terminal phosphate cyclase, partial [Acidobacteriota bacterium]